jgi:antitoxin component HigA of HigAB toxin-antitoxin module
MKKITIIRYFLDDNDVKTIKYFLLENNMNASSLAVELGCSRSYVSALLRGKRYVTNNMISKFKKIGLDLGV